MTFLLQSEQLYNSLSHLKTFHPNVRISQTGQSIDRQMKGDVAFTILQTFS